MDWRIVPVFVAFLPKEIDPGNASQDHEADNRSNRQKELLAHDFLFRSNAMPAASKPPEIASMTTPQPSVNGVPVNTRSSGMIRYYSRQLHDRKAVSEKS
jgi:hypothetical protein